MICQELGERRTEGLAMKAEEGWRSLLGRRGRIDACIAGEVVENLGPGADSQAGFGRGVEEIFGSLIVVFEEKWAPGEKEEGRIPVASNSIPPRVFASEPEIENLAADPPRREGHDKAIGESSLLRLPRHRYRQVCPLSKLAQGSKQGKGNGARMIVEDGDSRNRLIPPLSRRVEAIHMACHAAFQFPRSIAGDDNQRKALRFTTPRDSPRGDCRKEIIDGKDESLIVQSGKNGGRGGTIGG
ncbi:MAG TPA: hypothetical protein VMV44_01255 [Rectinemataceae bacterium]|nr:hypothetical protein [Rectinemataceae bacterium]